MFDHLRLQGAIPCDDTSIFDLYERNFHVTFPAAFRSFLSIANSARISAIYFHPTLDPQDQGNEFLICRIVSIGRHQYNERDDLLVLTDYEHFNAKSIPQRVIAFALDYREWPIYLDLTEGGDGRVVVHDDDDRLPRPSWANLDDAYPCAYISDSFTQYIELLEPDPEPPL